MNWFRISLPQKFLEHGAIIMIADEFNDVIATKYNNLDHRGALLLCDDPSFKNGSIYVSPQTMLFPELKKWIDCHDPVKCDISKAKNLCYLAGNKVYAKKIISDVNAGLIKPQKTFLHSIRNIFSISKGATL